MKKTLIYFIAGTLAIGTACTSTDTTTDDSTVSTTETMDTGTTSGTDMGTTTGTDATGTTGNTGTTGTGPNVSVTDLATLDDATFVMATASSNMFEIEAGNMAMKNAKDQKVKDFARMMVEHHTMANKELQSMASKMGVTMPTSMMAIHQAMMDKIDDKTGSGFDEDYMDTMETAHKMDIAMFEAKEGNATDQNLKAFVAKTLPMLKSHHQKATSIEDKVD